jgi:hypothetical protein
MTTSPRARTRQDRPPPASSPVAALSAVIQLRVGPSDATSPWSRLSSCGADGRGHRDLIGDGAGTRRRSTLRSAVSCRRVCRGRLVEPEAAVAAGLARLRAGLSQTKRNWRPLGPSSACCGRGPARRTAAAEADNARAEPGRVLKGEWDRVGRLNAIRLNENARAQ